MTNPTAGDGSTYDVIVVGGGIGGLTAANRLARFGCSVLLLEQHSRLGGLAAWFRRRGHIFDTALHGFPHGMLKTCRKYWSREMADCIIPLRSVRFHNPRFNLETSFTTEDFTRKLVEHFRVPRPTVERFFRECAAMNFFDDPGLTTRAFFERFFPGRNDVMRFVMEPITYANGSTLEEPALTYGIVFSNFMSKGIYFFQGGTDRFLDLARRELERNGVRVMLGTRVDEILVEAGKVAGVRAGDRTFSSHAVLGNTHVLALATRLLPASARPAAIRDLAARVRPSTSISQVYVGLASGEELPEIGDIIFHSTAAEFSPESYLADPPVSRSLSVYYPHSRPGHDRCSIVASMGARYRDWAGLTPAAYTRAKRELVERTLDVIDGYVPDIRRRLDHVEAATPLTFQRYTLHPDGATFGTKFPGLKLSEDLPKHVPGLYHAGSAGIIMSGWLGAANYGVIVANHIVEYLGK